MVGFYFKLMLNGRSADFFILVAGTAVDALKKGLADLQDVCDVVADEFWTKRQAFNAENGIES